MDRDRDRGRGRETATAATHVISAFCVNKKVNEPAERSSERGTPRGDEKVYVQKDVSAHRQALVSLWSKSWSWSLKPLTYRRNSLLASCIQIEL